VFELDFPVAINISGFTLDLGAMDDFSVTATVTVANSDIPVVVTHNYQHLPADPHVALDFSAGAAAGLPVKTFKLEIHDELAGASAHIHIREIGLLPKN
jgi:hypothetical protein